MDFSKYIDVSSLPEKARQELESFYEYLVFKYESIKKKNPGKGLRNNKFKAIQLDTTGFIFNREEANER